MKRLVILTCLICVPFTWGQSAEDRKATIAYLQKLQTDSGGFLPGGKSDKGSLRATSSALRALKYWGGEPRDAKSAAKFVDSCFDKATGGFVDAPGNKTDVTTTAIGLMAVVELKMPQEKYTEPAVKYLAENAKTFEEIRIAAAGLEAVGKRPAQADGWLEQVAKLRNPDGTYGKGPGTARATGSAGVVVLRLGGKVEQRENVVKALKAGQRADGGFGKEEGEGSDLETTYRVMRAFFMLKEKPDEAKVRAFVAKCRNADGGYGVAPGQPSNAGGTYFASIILHWLDAR